MKQGSSDEALSDGDLETVSQFMETSLASTLEAYKAALSYGVAPELARMILPQNMYTEFYMTGNLRNWAHFLKLRLDEHAQLEVQQIAQQVMELLQPLWPVSVEALMAHD